MIIILPLEIRCYINSNEDVDIKYVNLSLPHVHGHCETPSAATSLVGRSLTCIRCSNWVFSIPLNYLWDLIHLTMR